VRRQPESQAGRGEGHDAPADWREAANLVLIKAQEQRDAAKAAAADDK
jgi:hypothetical protein